MPVAATMSAQATPTLHCVFMIVVPSDRFRCCTSARCVAREERLDDTYADGRYFYFFSPTPFRHGSARSAIDGGSFRYRRPPRREKQRAMANRLSRFDNVIDI